MLPIHERFYTFQGEGCHMGKPAFFIRTFGCPLHCPWCDSAGTWHKDFVPAHINRMEEADLIQEASTALGRAGFIVVTGGEPTIHDLTKLTNMASDMHLRVHLETAGSFPIKGMFDWVTLSPKYSKEPLPENVRRANEFKLIIEGAKDIYYWRDFLVTNGWGMAKQPVWLHPEWSKRADPQVLSLITEAVKKSDGMFRAGWQMHKMYRADLLDTRSAPAVPLGGNPELGY